MELRDAPKAIAVMAPVEISSVDREYLNNRLHYHQVKQAKALKLRRQLIKQRKRFQQTCQYLHQSLSSLGRRPLLHPQFHQNFQACPDQ